MKLPFWRTKSAAAPLRIPSWATPLAAGDAPKSYEVQVREAYLGNPVAARAIRLVTESAGGAPLVSNPPGHPALALPLLVAGLHYESAPGMVPSAVVTSDGLDVDTMDVAGALSSAAISGADLLDGRYDGAAVELFVVDWRQPDAGRQRLAGGTIGSVEAGYGADSGFVASLRGLTAALAVPRIETYSPECRAAFGDWRCRVPLRGRSRRGDVLETADNRIRVAGFDPTAAEQAVQGRLRVESGPAAGLERSIIASDGDWLLVDAPLAVASGTRVWVLEGCDKRFVTCVGRFANGSNFRGEPHVPGNDLLTRFGGL